MKTFSKIVKAAKACVKSKEWRFVFVKQHLWAATNEYHNL